jgi:ATP-binding cassette subfamily B multidrug efflux pump
MPRPGRMTTERAKDFKGTLRQLLAAMSKYKLSLVVVIVFAVLSTIFNIAGPKILAKATTALATGWIAKLRGVGGIDSWGTDVEDAYRLSGAQDYTVRFRILLR